MALPLVGAFHAISFSPSRASLPGNSQGHPLVVRQRGSRERIRGRRLLVHCTNQVDVVLEGDAANDATDETDHDATDDTANANGDAADAAESSSSDDVTPIAWLKQQPLPYPSDALEPYMSRETVEQHWGVHQRAHVERLNGMIGGSEWEGMSLGQMMLSSFNQGRDQPHPPFFHAAQIWNHNFFWRSMKPGGGGKPPGRLLKLINRDFGSFDAMTRQFMDAALTQFGSGWVWLSYKGSRLPVGNARNPIPSEDFGRLVISKTPNAVNPLVWGHSPLLAIDVWEHAYYLDYENRRADYITTFLEKLVSWKMVDSRLKRVLIRAAKRDRSKRKLIKKQPTSRPKNRLRAWQKQANGEARDLPRDQPRKQPRSRQQQDDVAAAGQPATLLQQEAHGVELDHED